MMKKYILLICCFLCGISIFAQDKKQKVIVVKSGTPVLLEIPIDIASTSGKLINGSLIKVNLINEIRTNIDSILAPRGVAYCRVVKIQRSGRFGRSAAITIEAAYIVGIDGQLIPLYSDPIKVSEETREGSTAALSVVVPIVGGSLVKGKETNIAKGTIIEAEVAEDTRIKLF